MRISGKGDSEEGQYEWEGTFTTEKTRITGLGGRTV